MGTVDTIREDRVHNTYTKCFQMNNCMFITLLLFNSLLISSSLFGNPYKQGNEIHSFIHLGTFKDPLLTVILHGAKVDFRVIWKSFLA